MSKTYPVNIYNYRPIGDDGCSLTLHSTVEVDGDDMKYFHEHRGCQAMLFITDVPVGLKAPKIDIERIKASMVENKIYDKDITPSERQRRKIWVLYKESHGGQEPTQEEFEKYYLQWMDKIDDHLSEKIMDAKD